MIFLYLIIIISMGPTIIQILEKKDLIKISDLNIFEKIATYMMTGLLSFVLYMFIIGLLSIKYSFYLFVPLIINFIYQILFNIYSIIKKRIKFDISKKLNLNKVTTLILFVTFIIWVIYYMFVTITSYSIFPDEYSVWLLNPKNTFIGKGMNFFVNTGLEIYPNFLPLLFSGYYFFINSIEVNSVRIFSSLFMLIAGIGLVGLGKRKRININYLLIFLVYTLISYGIISQIITSTYGDIPFMVTYTLGMLYLFEWLVGNRNKTLLFIAIIHIMSYSFIKTEALYLVIFNIMLLILSSIFHKKLKIKKISYKPILIYSICSLFLPIAWKIYSIIANFPDRVILGASSVNINYTVPLLTNMTSQFFNCMPWVLALFILLVGLFIYGHKLEKKDQQFILLGVITIIANFGLLFVSYLALFGVEALTAASFIRYITRVFFIMVFISLLSIKNFTKVDENN